MLSCIDRLLSINDPCAQSACRGLNDISDVIGFTWARAADLAEGAFKESTGYQIAIKARRKAVQAVAADLMAEMQLRGWATNLTSGGYTTGHYKTNTITGSSAKRGIQITAQQKCVYSGMRLKSVSVKSATTVETTLHILSGNNETEVPISLIANKTLTLTNVCDADGVNIFTGESPQITIWIEDAEFSPIEVKPNCQTCSGGKANPCATSAGWSDNGSQVVTNKTMAYGIVADVQCECNYDLILCSLPNDELKSQLLLYGTSVQFARLALETSRFNYFTIHGRDELQEYIAIAQNGLKKRLTQYVESLRPHLMANKYCGCLKCDGSTLRPLV